MASRRRRWTPTQARRVVDDLERSGLTVVAFAQTRGLHPKAITEWRRRFKREAAAEVPRLVELVAAPPPVACSINLRCPSGHVIEVLGVDLTQGVQAMLAALQEQRPC